MSLLDDIKNKLVSDGIVDGSTGWKFYKAYLPDSPSNVVAIYEMPGPEPDQTQGIAYEYPGFQIYTRASAFEYDVARSKLMEVYRSLNNADIPGYNYIYAADSGPILDSYDKASNRPILFLSFNTMKAPSLNVFIGSANLVTSVSTNLVEGNSGDIAVTVPSATMGAIGG